MKKYLQEKEIALQEAEYGAYCILKAGQMLMQAGAEVFRVEETMTRMGYSIPNVSYCTSYVTVTGIICSVEVKGQTVTRMARLKEQSRNMAVVNAINELSRQAEKEHYSANALYRKLSSMKKIPDYSNGIKALWGAIGAAGFAIFFGGGPIEMLCVFFTGLLVRTGTVFLGKVRINEFFINVVLSFLSAVASVLFSKLVPGSSSSIMIISSIMLLVPGLTITNALRDSVMGEPLSSLVMLTQALLSSAAIAVGVLLGLYVMGAA